MEDFLQNNTIFAISLAAKIIVLRFQTHDNTIFAIILAAKIIVRRFQTLDNTIFAVLLAAKIYEYIRRTLLYNNS